MVMFMRPRAEDAAPVAATPGWTQFVMVASAATILVLGIMPEYAVRDAAVGWPRTVVPPLAQQVSPPPAATGAR